MSSNILLDIRPLDTDLEAMWERLAKKKEAERKKQLKMMLSKEKKKT